MVEWGVPVAVLMFLALWSRERQMQRCASVLGLNWLACTIMVEVTGNLTPWAWFWVLDLLSAIVVMIHPAGRVQRMLAWSYLVQIGFHTGFALMHGSAMTYLQALDAMLVIQMALILAWTLGHGLPYPARLRVFISRHHEAHP